MALGEGGTTSGDDAPTLVVGVVDEYLEMLTRRGIDPSGLAADEGGTIRPRRRTSRTVLIPAAEDLGSGAEIQIGETIGQGGMGVIKQAEQLRLRRNVAVKLVTADDAGLAREQLVREALVTGALEHPNIVPVYTLTTDAKGMPALVMKNIEGIPWSQLITDPDAHQFAGSARSPREFHLGILQQVCNAVHFAHSRGIVHRDLKPSNVMIGRFGEVYVLDWGVAVSIGESSDHIAPPPAPKELVGTPGYMAPEMAVCDVGRIDVTTDVYMLGAVLHEIVTHRKRHDEGTVFANLAAAARSEPFHYHEDVPAELAAICNRATHRDPAHRFPTAEGLRQAIAAFNHHAAAQELLSEAKDRLALLRQRATVAPEEESEDAAADVHRLYAEARFAFQQARRTWPDSEVAALGFETLILTMVDYQIARENRDAAAALLTELDAVPESVRGRMTALEGMIQRRRANIASLRAKAKDHDIHVTAKRRAENSAMLAGATLVLIGVPAIAHHVGWWEAGYLEAMAVALAILVVGLGLGTRTPATSVGRNVLASLSGSILFFTFQLGLCMAIGLPYPRGVALSFTTFGLAMALMGLMVSRPFLAAAPPLALGGAVALIFPSHPGIPLGLGTIAAFLIVAVVSKLQAQHAID